MTQQSDFCVRTLSRLAHFSSLRVDCVLLTLPFVQARLPELLLRSLLLVICVYLDKRGFCNWFGAMSDSSSSMWLADDIYNSKLDPICKCQVENHLVFEIEWNWCFKHVSKILEWEGWLAESEWTPTKSTWITLITDSGFFLLTILDFNSWAFSAIKCLLLINNEVKVVFALCSTTSKRP